MDNLSVNKQHYDQQYSSVSVDWVVERVESAATTLPFLINNNLAGFADFFRGDFQQRVKGAEILELGAGNGLNALLMVAMGAKRVVANDISVETGRIVEQAAARLGFQNVSVLIGDFAEMDIAPASFDLVVGRSFLHHLTDEQEIPYLDKTRAVLRRHGEGRFLEPMRNSSLVEEARWLIPAAGRPSKLNAAAFQKWKEADPHPTRDNSSAHYEVVGRRFFDEVIIYPSRFLERVRRFFPNNTAGARVAGRMGRALDNVLPTGVVRSLGSQQTIVYRLPKASK